MLQKLAGIPPSIIGLIYSVFALPLIGFIAIQVYEIKADSKAQKQHIEALEKELNTQKVFYDRQLDTLSRQVDYLIKRLIDKTSLWRRPYLSQQTPVTSTNKNIMWLVPYPGLVSTDRRKLRVTACPA